MLYFVKVDMVMCGVLSVATRVGVAVHVVMRCFLIGAWLLAYGVM